MNGYLVPANAKKGTLIFNIFRPFDLILFCVGIGVSLLSLAIVPSSNIVAVLLAMIPGGVATLLIFPIPNYHNVMCALISMYKFYTERRRYVWKGWCFNEQFTSDEPTGSTKSTKSEKSEKSDTNK